MYFLDPFSLTGVLSGGQLRPLLLRKGAPMNVLAHIWALCDINATGMLNEEQYALAVHLIQLHLVSCGDQMSTHSSNERSLIK